MAHEPSAPEEQIITKPRLSRLAIAALLATVPAWITVVVKFVQFPRYPIEPARGCRARPLAC